MQYIKNAQKKNIRTVKDYMQQGIPLIVWDTETTGLDQVHDRILSFSAIRIARVNGRYQEVERINQFINPERPIPEEVTQINHISNETVRNAPTEREAAGIIRTFLREHPLLCGYNSTRFDIRFLDAMYKRVYGEPSEPLFHIDVLDMAKEQTQRPWRLSNVASNLGADRGLTFHNSMDDVIATYRVFSCLCACYIGAAEEVMEVHPERAIYWERYGIQRIYVDLTPKIPGRAYYDCEKKRWIADVSIDRQELRREVLDLYQCRDEAELLAMAKR